MVPGERNDSDKAPLWGAYLMHTSSALKQVFDTNFALLRSHEGMMRQTVMDVVFVFGLGFVLAGLPTSQITLA